MDCDTRPAVYRYYDQLMAHLGGDTGVFFDGSLIYPRQFEIHLPSNHIRPCNLYCFYCAGKYFKKDLGSWEPEGLELLQRLEGRIPYHIYGGAYTEPTLNPYFMSFLSMTKRTGCHFGIHTNGTLLSLLEKHQGWLTELNRISTDAEDYLSISLDAGTPQSWAEVKGLTSGELFHEIIDGIRKAIDIRLKAGKGHAVRICYLLNRQNNSPEDIENIVSIARDIGVDSLRFSIPFGSYNQSFETIREYKAKTEVPMDKLCGDMLLPYLSGSESDIPYIFYVDPGQTDIDKFDFTKCIYSYYQMTYGADGYGYKCSTTATPTMAMCRLGRITSDMDKFNQMILRNQNENWDARVCFDKGARCNRMGLEINREYDLIRQDKKLR